MFKIDPRRCYVSRSYERLTIFPIAKEIENMATKEAWIVQPEGGYFLAFPPGDNHVW